MQKGYLGDNVSNNLSLVVRIPFLLKQNLQF
jgi:hypothetical protein